MEFCAHSAFEPALRAPAADLLDALDKALQLDDEDPTTAIAHLGTFGIVRVPCA